MRILLNILCSSAHPGQCEDDFLIYSGDILCCGLVRHRHLKKQRKAWIHFTSFLPRDIASETAVNFPTHNHVNLGLLLDPMRKAHIQGGWWGEGIE
jgi:hypothetical protein